jgi:hypothetical protein
MKLLSFSNNKKKKKPEDKIKIKFNYIMNYFFFFERKKPSQRDRTGPEYNVHKFSVVDFFRSMKIIVCVQRFFSQTIFFVSFYEK